MVRRAPVSGAGRYFAPSGHRHCWLAVLDGEVRETQYEPLRVDDWQQRLRGAAEPTGASAAHAQTDDTSPLIFRCTTDLQAGDVAYINDLTALHSVGCPADARPRAVTSPPPSSEEEEDKETKEEEEEEVFSTSRGSGAPATACTLHLYCPPIRRVKAFEGGKVTDCVPGFFSRHSLFSVPAPSTADGCSIA
ncbi:hypothetical protein GPECTOR_1g334 [Gonium pectorale]|uniref:cysteine dioxygenase n=1 Tax=Gonium pectorale TaxID=33097 RepID=A0A150H2H4_GONPE|nr:hypothetical protein GPECTOR_1g334 [Gonium pectorale]|eukprot:KXZ56377.1 hypothetical protein GPECTOR_1g334 [Gonium pectorale]